MRRWLRCFIVLAWGMGVAAGWAQREESPSERAEWLHPVTLGIRAQENEAEGVGDILLPLWRGPRSVLLANVRGAMSDHDEEEVNAGLGVRHLPDTRIPFMIGGFVFYDGRWTRHHNRFDQLGLSAEVLSDWVDGRFNYYLPNHDTALVDREETLSIRESRQVRDGRSTTWGDPYGQIHSILQERVTTWTRQETFTQETIRQFFENREAALEGWDAEIGLRLPLCERWFETRIFAGYQYFDHPFGGHLKGAQGRIELRALEGRLLLDAQVFENRELNQSDWRAGVRLRLPFELSALAQGRNPFAQPETTGRRDLRARFDEMVIRDPKIQIQKSGYVEDVAKRALETKSRTTIQTRTERETEVIAEGVTFVDGDKGNDSNPGTAERPKGTIQGGVDGAPAGSRLYTMNWPDGRQRRLVYVESASAPYVGDTVISAPGIGLLGSGLAVPGYGGKAFGGGARPVLMSPLDASVRVLDTAGGVGIAGFEFASVEATSGIRSDSGRVLVWDNDFRDLLHGVAVYTVDANVDSWVVENRFSGNGRAVHVGAQGAGAGDFNLRVEGNVIADGTRGAYVTAEGYANASVAAVGNEMRELTGEGLAIGVELGGATPGFAMVDIRNNVAEQVGLDDGTYAVHVVGDSGDGRGVYRVVGNRVTGADGGIRVDADGLDQVSVLLERNDVSDCVQGGMGLHLSSGGRNVAAILMGNTARGNGGAGLTFAGSTQGGDILVDAAGNRAEGNGAGGGLSFSMNSQGGNIEFRGRENVVADNAGTGLAVDALSGGGTANLDVVGNRAVGGDVGIRVDAESEGVVSLLLEGNEVSGSADSGIRVTVRGVETGDVEVAADRNVTRDTGGVGLRVIAETEDGIANVQALENESSGAGTGMQFRVASENHMAMLGMMGNRVYDNTRGLMASVASSNLFASLWAQRNVAQSNEAAGIEFDLQGGGLGAIAYLAQNTASGNGGLGSVMTGGSAGVGGLTVVAEDNVMSLNGAGGMRLEMATDGGDLDVEVSGNEARGNEGHGLVVEAAVTGGDLDVALVGNTVEANEANGLGLRVVGASSGRAGVTIQGNQAIANSWNGLHLQGNMNGMSGEWLVEGNRVIGNPQLGIAMAGTRGDVVAWHAVRNVVEGNGYGILLNWATAPVTDDFVLTQNSLANSVFNLVYDASVGLDARGNWWGAAPPNGGMIVQDGAGAIDWSNWLPVRPDLP